MKLVCVYKGGKRKSQREIYTDGDTACLLALGLMGLFLVWIGVSVAVGSPCPLVVSFLFHLTLSLQATASICLNKFEFLVYSARGPMSRRNYTLSYNSCCTHMNTCTFEFHPTIWLLH